MYDQSVFERLRQVDKLPRIVGYLLVSLLLLTDILRATAGVLSLIELTGFEVFSIFELGGALFFLVKSYILLKASKCNFNVYCIIFGLWITALIIVYLILNSMAQSISRHWDAQVLDIANGGSPPHLVDVVIEKNIPRTRNCIIYNKKRYGTFPWLFQYQLRCDNLDTLLDVRTIRRRNPKHSSIHIKLDETA